MTKDQDKSEAKGGAPWNPLRVKSQLVATAEARPDPDDDETGQDAEAGPAAPEDPDPAPPREGPARE